MVNSICIAQHVRRIQLRLLPRVGAESCSKRCVSVKSYLAEGRAIARALEYMKELSPRVTVHMEKVQLAGCRLLPTTAERVITNSTVRIRCLTFVDKISDSALRHQIAVTEQHEQRRFHGTFKPATYVPTAIIALDLSNVVKAKSLRAVSDAIFGASHIVRHNQILVLGVPNSGKSSIILPITKARTLTVRNKKSYHLPKVSDRAGMTIAVKKHVMDSNVHREVTLIDTPGLRPRLEGADPRQAALFFAAHVTEVFPGFEEIAPPHLIFETLLRAANRHATISGSSPPLYVEQLGMDEPTEDPDVLIQAYIASCLEGNATKFKAKPLLRRFHAGDFGGLIFGPYDKQLQEQASNLRFNRSGSPIVYMNESALRLVAVANGSMYSDMGNHDTTLSN